jgi:hypothetical protein
VPSHVTDAFVILFRPGLDEDEADRLAMEFPEDDLVEPLPPGGVDLGEIVAQQLSIAMDPYPRKSDAAAIEVAQDPPQDAPAGPFAALRPSKRP